MQRVVKLRRRIIASAHLDPAGRVVGELRQGDSQDAVGEVGRDALCVDAVGELERPREKARARARPGGSGRPPAAASVPVRCPRMVSW